MSATSLSATSFTSNGRVYGLPTALSQVGLPPHDIPLALLLFNVGVEAGQLAFVGAVLAVIAIVRRVRDAHTIAVGHQLPDLLRRDVAAEGRHAVGPPLRNRRVNLVRLRAVDPFVVDERRTVDPIEATGIDCCVRLR